VLAVAFGCLDPHTRSGASATVLVCMFSAAWLACGAPPDAKEDHPAIAARAVLAGSKPAGACTGTIDRAAPVLSNGFGFGLTNQRNQASALRASNVSKLEVAFAHAAIGATGKRGAPAVTEQAIFFSAAQAVIGMDRTSGCTYWTYNIPNVSTGLLGDNHLRSSTVYLIHDVPDKPALVVVGDALGYVYAIDAVSGDLVWRRFLGTNPTHHWITGGFQYHNGKLFVPFSSREVITAAVSIEPCCTTHGILHAVDPFTGATIWTYHTTAEAVFDPVTFKNGPSGAGIWGVAAIDEHRNQLYIGTGQNYSPPKTDTSDAIIALDLDTGARRWAFQALDGDIWNAACELPAGLDGNCARPAGHDFDFGAPPVLVTLSDRTDLVLGATKGGVVYAIRPDDGSLVWSRRVGKGSALGGVHWGIAVDDSRAYVAVTDAFVDKTSALAGQLLDLLGEGSLPIEPVAGGTPGIYALHLKTGEQAWYVQPKHMYEGQAYVSIFSAALTVSNDVLFAAALDGELLALRTDDGSELWRFDSDVTFCDVNGAPGKGGTVDSVGAVLAGNMLLLNSGYDNFGGRDAYQAGTGNALFILALP
jgi:polyvinyl alcohol dehydrogenase (cytochrome)